ncbi:AAA family ATPase [Segeticoccus rhizosphaerae]|uniref:AAA family ATPase n=1 Tax=Segeticoccus rhizosphaerae TaxID=1104777 RepID=UPI0010C063FA|nr:MULTISPECIES: AAA family ATPase [Intrasporangiaceae]
MTFLWETDHQAAENLRLALGHGMRVVESAPAAHRSLADDRREILLVIGPDIDLTSALTVADSLRLERPEVGVVLMRRRLDVGVLAQSLRAGVREVVSADDLSSLTEACSRSQQLSTRLAGLAGGSEAAEGRIVTVFSAKGGCGKTTVSTNMAAELALDRTTRVLLIDLDLAFGDVAISLGLMPERSIADVVAMAGHLDAEGLASVVTHHDSGLDALCAPAHPGDADRIPAAVVAEVLRVAKKVYDVVVIDTPPAFTEHVLTSFDACDASVLLATLDIPAVKNLRLALDTLDLLGHPKANRLLVLNRADAKVGLSVDDVTTALHHELAQEIPDNRAVTAATNRGVPVVLHEPKNPVSLALKALVRERLRPAIKMAVESPMPVSKAAHRANGRRFLRRAEAGSQA